MFSLLRRNSISLGSINIHSMKERLKDKTVKWNVFWTSFKLRQSDFSWSISSCAVSLRVVSVNDIIPLLKIVVVQLVNLEEV